MMNQFWLNNKSKWFLKKKRRKLSQKEEEENEKMKNNHITVPPIFYPLKSKRKLQEYLNNLEELLLEKRSE